METEAQQPEAVPATQLESLRIRYASLADRVECGELPLEEALAIAEGRDSKPRSGYARLRVRHRQLIAEHETLKSDYEQQQIEQAALRRDVDNLLAQHSRLMEAAKTPAQNNSWFETANRTIGQLVMDPDQRAVDVMTASLVSLLQKLSQIKMRGSI